MRVMLELRERVEGHREGRYGCRRGLAGEMAQQEQDGHPPRHEVDAHEHVDGHVHGHVEPLEREARKHKHQEGREELGRHGRRRRDAAQGPVADHGARRPSCHGAPGTRNALS